MEGALAALARLGPSEGDLRDRKRVPNVLKLDSSLNSVNHNIFPVSFSLFYSPGHFPLSFLLDSVPGVIHVEGSHINPLASWGSCLGVQCYRYPEPPFDSVSGRWNSQRLCWMA